MKRRWSGLVGSLVICAMTFVGCTKKSEYGLDVKETLRININTEPPSLDWNKSTDTTSSLIQDNIMEGLVSYDLKDPELGLKAGLATEWSASKDVKTWTFTIRQGVKWTDGVEFTAQQVVDGWERLLNPQTASEYAYFLFEVKNARAYNEGKLKDFAQVGVKADGNKLIVELENSKSYFPYLLTHHSTYPIRKDVIAKHGDKWTEPENIQTLGAYKLKIWEHDKNIVLERNDTYYGEKAKTKFVLAYMINEMSTAVNLFDSGKLDIQNQLPSRELASFKQRKEYRDSGILSLYYYGFNTKMKPFDNPLVRQAFNHAIDRRQIVQMLAGGQIPLTSWVPAGMFGYEPDSGLGFNPEKARELLKQAGYETPDKFPKISLAFNTNEDHQRVAENVQAQLKKNLGISIELKNEEWKVYLKTLQSNTPALFRLGWLADYPDPDNFLNLMTSYSENNHTKWGSSKFDDLIKKGVSEADKEKRRAIYAEAQKILVEAESPVMPIYSSVTQALVSERVKNFSLNRLNRYIFKDVELQ